MTGGGGMTARARRIAASAILTAGAIAGSVCLLWTLAILAAGVTPLVVQSGSMAPTLEAGDVAFARSVAARDIREGDVVSVTTADGIRITHRVTATTPESGDAVVLRLRGDANDGPDAELYPVTSALVVVARLPGLGFVLHGASTPAGIAAGAALLAACLVIGWRASRPDDPVDPATRSRRRRHSARIATGTGLVVVLLLGLGSAAAPQGTIAYFTDTPNVRTPTNGLDAAPWFTCHQAMTSPALSAFAYYRFNDAVGSTTAADVSGNGRTADMGTTSGTSYAFGQAQACARDTDTAVRFDGVTGYAASPNIAAIGGAAGARWNTFTVSIWFRGEAVSAGGALLTMSNSQNGQGTNYDRNVYVDAQGRLRFGVFANGVHTLATPAVGQPGYQDFRAARWHLVTASLSSAGMALWIDGERLGPATTEQGESASLVTAGFQYSQAGPNAYWTIGSAITSGWPGGAAGSHWKGLISKVGIWERALTDQQIRDLYRSGIPLRP